MRLTSTAASVVAAALWLASPAWAEHLCSEIEGPIVTTYSFAGCSSPVGICTTGTVQLPHETATTGFTALSVTQGPTPDVMFYTGLLTITTRAGVLTLRDSGVLNTTNGTFFEVDEIVSGTKRYRNVTGALSSQGVATGTGFSGTIGGAICRVFRGVPER